MRRRRLTGLLIMVGLFAGGLGLAWAQTGEPTIATQTFVVTYTIPTETVTTEVTVTETVTVPTTTEPPSDGTVIETSTRWLCTAPLTSLGELPIILEQRVTNAHARTLSNGLVGLNAGCTGDGDPDTVDLIVRQYGNGRDQGSDDDGLVIRAGAHDITVSGFVDCGWINPGPTTSPPHNGDEAHQDAVVWNAGGDNIRFQDFRTGNWDTQQATCHGAGGNFYPDPNTSTVTGALCLRCLIVASKTGIDPEAGPAGTGVFIGNNSVDSGIRDSCVSANVPLTLDPAGAPTRPVNINNVLVDRNDGTPDNPGACPLEWPSQP